LIRQLGDREEDAYEILEKLEASLIKQPNAESVWQLVGMIQGGDNWRDKDILNLLQRLAHFDDKSLESSIPDLTRLVLESTGKQQFATIELLGLIGKRAASSAEALRTIAAIGRPIDRDRIVALMYRARAAGALLRIDPDEHEPDAVPFLCQMTKAEHVNVRATAFGALRFSQSTDARVKDAYVAAFSDRDQGVQALAIDGALNSGAVTARAVVPQIKKLLTQPSVGVITRPYYLSEPRPSHRQIIASFVPQLGANARDVVPELIEMLGSRDFEEQVFAILSMGRIGPDAAAALPALRQLKAGGAPAIRYVRDAIAKIEKEQS
jgi:hypothetical protein